MSKRSYGVIVGRFQVNDLHDGHMELFRQVKARHNGVIVFVGSHPAGLTKDHPLNFEVRKRMIEAKFPDFIVREIRDTRNDEMWSKNLDEMIGNTIDGPVDIVLYGGRDSFVPHYTGKYKPVELTLSLESQKISGTAIRDRFATEIVQSSDFRAGMIYAAAQLWPVILGTVDVAIFTTDYSQILLGQKDSDPKDKWRFVGGHFSTTAHSNEADARKETYEETTLDSHKMEYIGSANIPDWRYNTSDRAVRTAFYATTVTSQGAKAKDDIVAVRWFKTADLFAWHVVDTHQPLFILLLEFLKKKGIKTEEAQNGSTDSISIPATVRS
jgi:bifunctional NMN adenylyltransferase/nudix hydrolase